MNLTNLDKKYVSDIDNFLVEFDKRNPKRSQSQLEEIRKSERVSRLMQNPETTSEKPTEIWDKF